MFRTTEVALNLARELEVTVDRAVFRCRKHPRNPPDSLAREVLSCAPRDKGTARAHSSQIGSRWISVPVSASPYYIA